MAEDNSKGIWAIVGKIAVVVGIAGGLIGIYTWYHTKEASLAATVRYSNINLPDKLVAKLTESNLEQNDEIKQLLPKGYVFDKLGEALKKKRDTRQSMIDEITKLNSYYEVNLTNTGSKEATGLTLQVPINGYFQLRNVNGDSELKTFSRIIQLDNLRPTNNVIVSIWTGDTAPSKTLDLIKITSPEDVVRPENLNIHQTDNTIVVLWIATAFASLLSVTLFYLFYNRIKLKEFEVKLDRVVPKE